MNSGLTSPVVKLPPSNYRRQMSFFLPKKSITGSVLLPAIFPSVYLFFVYHYNVYFLYKRSCSKRGYFFTIVFLPFPAFLRHQKVVTVFRRLSCLRCQMLFANKSCRLYNFEGKICGKKHLNVCVIARFGITTTQGGNDPRENYSQVSLQLQQKKKKQFSIIAGNSDSFREEKMLRQSAHIFEISSCSNKGVSSFP